MFLAHVALIVRDYDEAIAWFTRVLGFTLVADQHQPERSKRWVLVARSGAGENAATLLLARATTPEQAAFTPGETAFPTPPISWSTLGMDQPLRFTRAPHCLHRPARASRILRDIVNFMNFTSARGA